MNKLYSYIQANIKFTMFNYCTNRRRDRTIRAPVSNYEDPGFKLRTGKGLIWLRLFCFFPASPRKSWDSKPTLKYAMTASFHILSNP